MTEPIAEVAFAALLGGLVGLPLRAFEGRSVDLELRLRNPGRLPVLAEVFEEIPADLWPDDPHWPRVVLPAGETLPLRYSVTPRIRGDRPLGAVLLLERSPLGLLRRRGIGPADDVLRVYPDASRFLRPEALDPKRVLAAIGALAWCLWRVGLPWAAGFAAILMAIHPWHLRYISEARGYSLLLLCIPLLLGTMVAVLHRGTWRRWIAFGSVEVVLLWVYPAGVTILAVANAALLFEI